MLNSEFFIKIRAYIVLTFLVITCPIPIIFAWIYRTLELFIRCRKFKNIQGEVAVVTGGGHGLGRCIALLLAKRGCKVAIADINIDGAEETVKMIKSKYNIKCKAYKVDVSDYDQVLDLNNKIKKDLGVATILINNAGIITMSSFARPKPEEIIRMINVNTISHFWTNRIFLENMKSERKGHIVAICSIAGMFPLIYNSQYTCTKFGMRGMMRALRLELKANNNYKNIYTTTICPSFLQTNSKAADIANEIEVGFFYPLLNGEDAAKSILHAMLRNEVEITLPRGFAILARIFDAFPTSCQDTLYNLVTKSVCKKFQKIYEEREENALEEEHKIINVT